MLRNLLRDTFKNLPAAVYVALVICSYLCRWRFWCCFHFKIPACRSALFRGLP